MLKKKIIPVFLASVLTVSGTTGFVTEAFSEMFMRQKKCIQKGWQILQIC